MGLVIDIRVQGRVEHSISYSDPAVAARLDRIESVLSNVAEGVAHMSQEVDNLKAAVEAENTVIDSAIALLNGLSAQIASLKNDPVALQALADEVAAKSAELSGAVVANTPAP